MYNSDSDSAFGLAPTFNFASFPSSAKPLKIAAYSSLVLSSEISSSRFSDSRKAYDISAYIEEHHNSVTLNSLAAHFGYTPEYTSRLIRKITGSSFMELLSESRMKHAIALLNSTSLPVSNVANAVGYESTENFIRVFKKRYSMTPSAYRRTANKNMIL